MVKTIIMSLALLAGSSGSAQAQNLIRNGDFSQNLSHWTANQPAVVNAQKVFESRVTWVGNPWDWNLSHPLSLKQDTKYKMTFRARASQPRELIAGWGLNEDPWQSDVKTYALSTQWQSFEWVGEVSYPQAAKSRLIFDYGHQFGTVYLDDVKIEAVTAANNLLANGDFSQGLTAWSSNQLSQGAEGGSFVANVINPAQAWDWNISQGVSLKSGVQYRLKFRAKASRPREVFAGWGKNEEPWDADVKAFALSQNWQNYEIVGYPSFAPFANSRVLFDYGHQQGAVYLDDVVLEELNALDQFVTEDGRYTLGEHKDAQGRAVYTEVFYDSASAYLSPRTDGPHGAGWIIDNAQASTAEGRFRKGSVVFKGLYVEDCRTGEWINVLNTEYAFTSNPLSIYPSMNQFSLNHFYPKTFAVYEAPLVFLSERFMCDRENDPATYQSVALPGIDENADGRNDVRRILVEGTGRFAYVVEHR